jgi:hypothetical protein
MDWVLNVIDGVNGMEIESKRKARVVLFIKKITINRLNLNISQYSL